MLRRLVRCSRCARQFDATGRAVGERFHCHCGELVTVAEVAAHDAAVVRCSACGGARQGQENDCAFCGSTLTLHECDLHTMCPACFARVSDRAKFCHHCGVAIAAVEPVEGLSDRSCPVCLDKPLAHRSLGTAAAILECRHCAGLWVPHSVFSALVRQAEATAPALPSVAPPPQPLRPQAGPMYRVCPVCKTTMLRQNYARVSGVIIDSCKQDGVWFDAQELETLLVWLRAGGAASLRAGRVGAAPPPATRSFEAGARPPPSIVQAHPPPTLVEELAEALAAFLER